MQNCSAPLQTSLNNNVFAVNFENKFSPTPGSGFGRVLLFKSVSTVYFVKATSKRLETRAKDSRINKFTLDTDGTHKFDAFLWAPHLK